MNTSDARKPFKEELTGTVSEIINQVKKLIREGNARQIMIQDSRGKIVFQSPLTVGVGGATIITAIAPVVSAIGMFALFINDVTIMVERYPDEERPETEDEYEIEADIIEIRDAEEEGDENNSDDDTSSDDKTNKTVGKDEEQ